MGGEGEREKGEREKRGKICVIIKSLCVEVYRGLSLSAARVMERGGVFTNRSNPMMTVACVCVCVCVLVCVCMCVRERERESSTCIMKLRSHFCWCCWWGGGWWGGGWCCWW